jgi:very-short-patch-repair endonuclease
MDSGIPAPMRQREIRDRNGVLLARVDFAYPDAKLAIEIDGARYHAGTLDWRRDLARQNTLIAADWRVIRFTADDLALRPTWITRVVLGALGHDVRI